LVERWLVLVLLVVGCADQKTPVATDGDVIRMDAPCPNNGPTCADWKTIATCIGGTLATEPCPADKSLCHPCENAMQSCAFCYEPPGIACVPDSLNTSTNCVDADTARTCRGTPSDGYIWVYEECPNYCHIHTGTLGSCV
jgi:hypothetical protein